MNACHIDSSPFPVLPPRGRRASEIPTTLKSAILRQPPIDPRKFRRFCTDFGLGREPVSKQARDHPLWIEIASPLMGDDHSTSAGSTPLATYTGTDSDTSSLYQNIEFDFPQPPSMNELALRRMQSSPSFAVQAKNGHVDGRMAPHATLVLPGDSGAERGGFLCKDAERKNTWHNGRVDGLSKELDLDLEEETLLALEVAGAGCARSEYLPRLRSPRAASSDLSGLLGPYAPRNDGRPETTLTMPHFTPCAPSIQTFEDSGGVARAPMQRTHIVRRIASIQLSPKYENDVVLAPRPIFKSKSLRFGPEPTEALDRLEVSIKKLKAYEPSSHRSWATFSRRCTGLGEFTTGKGNITPAPKKYTEGNCTPYPPSLASAGRQKPSHHLHMSVPMASLGLPNTVVHGPNPAPSSTAPHNSLASPFLHRATRSQPASLMSFLEMEAIPRSFIDITPEQEVHRESTTGSRKARVRKLLARASNSALEWGRILTARKAA